MIVLIIYTKIIICVQGTKSLHAFDTKNWGEIVMKIIDVLLEWTTWLKLLFYQIYKVSKICKKLSHAVARTSGCIWTNKLSVIFYPSFHHSSILLCWLNVSCFIIESLSMKLINLQWKYIFSCLDKSLKKTRLIHNTSEVHPQTFNRNL